jgi:hypothetical protein
MNASTILDRLDTIINRDDYTRVLGLAVLNEFIRWIENEGNWTFMESLDTSQTTVDGTSAYTVPTRFKDDIDVSLEDSEGNVTYLTEWRSTTIDRSRPNTNTEQKPNSYYYFADQLYLVPTPNDDEWTIGQRCYVYLADLTDSTGSTNKLTEEHANLLICGVARNILNIFEDYEAAKVWHEGLGKGMNFKDEWSAFLKKETRKILPSSTKRMSMRVK